MHALFARDIFLSLLCLFLSVSFFLSLSLYFYVSLLAKVSGNAREERHFHCFGFCVKRNAVPPNGLLNSEMYNHNNEHNNKNVLDHMHSDRPIISRQWHSTVEIRMFLSSYVKLDFFHQVPSFQARQRLFCLFASFSTLASGRWSDVRTRQL